jgi:aspartate/methionine/tyrosine aminotransferase
VPVVERLAQNLFICASALAQHAALACFEPDSLAEYEARRAQFKARRDYFLPELERLGLHVPVRPDGAFYAYADASSAIEKLALSAGRPDGTGGSWDLAFALMQQARVVVTPGRDFGQADPHRYLRFSTASSMDQLQQAVARLEAVLG